MISPAVARRAVAAARLFQKREYWDRFANEDVIAFELPGEALPTYATILGSAGQHYGLSLYRGERALDQLREVCKGPRPAIVATMLVLSFDPPGAVAPELRTVATIAGISERIIPVFFTVRGGLRGREPRDAELRCMAMVLDAIELADARGILKPRRFHHDRAGKVLTLQVTGAGREIDVVARFDDVAAPPQVQAAGTAWPAGDLPLVDEHWVVGLEPSPLGVRDEPSRAFVLVVVGADDGHLHGLRMVFGADGEDLAETVDELSEVFTSHHGEGALPRRLTFVHQRLHDALAVGLQEAGVTTDLVEEHRAVSEVLRGLCDHLDPAALERVPEGGDVAGWTAVHQRLLDRISASKEAAGFDSRRALEAFFGEADTLARLEELGATVPASAYRHWFVMSFRGRQGRRTIAERLFDADLPAPERLVLQAEMQARAGIYRVVRVEAPLVVVADILGDHEVDVVDGGLAASVEAGDHLPCRIADAAGHRFMIPVGPKLAVGLVEPAVRHLEALGFRMDSVSLQQHPEALGRIWMWLLDARGEPPAITNTDGERVRLQTATFHVSDAAALASELAGRSDVEALEPDHWLWRRGDAGDATVLATLELVGDELLVTTNSDARLTAARQWLEGPGITFLRSRMHEVGEGPPPEGSRPIDPARLPPETLRDLQAHLDRRYMGWLDECIPMLGGRTPREVVATAAGREQVLRLIRSMPDPEGVPGVKVPRAAMRRSLGLEGGAAEA